MDDEVNPELVAFLCQETGSAPNKIRRQTQLRRDLGVEGDDGVELIEAFGRRFGVDVSGCTLGLYFGPEGSVGPIELLLWIGWAITRQLPRFVPITVDDLEASIRAKRWIAPSGAPS